MKDTRLEGRLWIVLALLLLLAIACGCGDDDDDDDPVSDDDDDSPDDDDDDDDDNDDDDNNDDNDDDNDDDTAPTLVYLEDLPVLRLKGDAYRRGYDTGVLMGDRTVNMYQEYILKYALGLSPEYVDLFAFIRNLACFLLDMTEDERSQLEGIMDGIADNWDTTMEMGEGTEIEMNVNDLCIANAVADFGQIACSSVSAWGSLTEDGQPMIARNLDWSPGPDRMLGPGTVVFSETPDDQSWHLVSIGWPGLIGCYNCINGDGDSIFIHDTARFQSRLVLHIAPRTLLMRRALQAAQGAADPFAAAESTIESGNVDTGNNFHFMSLNPANAANPSACFEVDDNDQHEDGFATRRTSQDTDVSATTLTEALFVTNHHRKRYAPSGCWRYDLMIQTVEAMAAKGDPIGLPDLHETVKLVELGDLTVHTVLYSPVDRDLWLYRIGPDHLASEDVGVQIPWSTLTPW